MIYLSSTMASLCVVRQLLSPSSSYPQLQGPLWTREKLQMLFLAVGTLAEDKCCRKTGPAEKTCRPGECMGRVVLGKVGERLAGEGQQQQVV